MRSAHEQQEKSQNPIRKKAGGKELRVLTTLPLCHSDLLRKFCYAPRSKIWTYESRVVRCNPTSGDTNAKWCAWISKRVLINPSHKHALKTDREHMHTRADMEAENKADKATSDIA